MTEKVTFTYGAVKIAVGKQSPSGAISSTVFGSWNQTNDSTSMLVRGYQDASLTLRIK